jgi:hypothetical protein
MTAYASVFVLDLIGAPTSCREARLPAKSRHGARAEHADGEGQASLPSPSVLPFERRCRLLDEYGIEVTVARTVEINPSRGGCERSVRMTLPRVRFLEGRPI